MLGRACSPYRPVQKTLYAAQHHTVCCSISLQPHEPSAIFESIESCSTPGHQYVPHVLLMNSNSEICLPTNVATVATVGSIALFTDFEMCIHQCCISGRLLECGSSDAAGGHNTGSCQPPTKRGMQRYQASRNPSRRYGFNPDMLEAENRCLSSITL